MLGVIPWVLMLINSVMEFFLCIDRCLSVLFPFKYNENQKNAFTCLTVFGLLGGVILVIWLNRLIFMYPLSPISGCRFIGCFVQQSSYSMLLIKIIFVLLNIVAAIILGILLKVILKSSSQFTRQMNNRVLLMVVATTIIELVPYGIAQIFSTVSKRRFNHVMPKEIPSLFAKHLYFLPARLWHNVTTL